MTHVWEGPKGQQVPIWITNTSNRLYKLVPLSLEGGSRLATTAKLLDMAPAMLEFLRVACDAFDVGIPVWPRQVMQDEARAILRAIEG